MNVVLFNCFKIFSRLLRDIYVQRTRVTQHFCVRTRIGTVVKISKHACMFRFVYMRSNVSSTAARIDLELRQRARQEAQLILIARHEVEVIKCFFFRDRRLKHASKKNNRFQTYAKQNRTNDEAASETSEQPSHSAALINSTK